MATRTPLRVVIGLSALGVALGSAGHAPKEALAQGANELTLLFETGSDDLRGGNDNVHVVLLTASGPVRFDDVNAKARWADHTSRVVTRPLPASIKSFADVKGVRLETTLSGGVGGDNWNLDRLRTSARIGGEIKVLDDRKGSPLFRFTGDARTKELVFASAGPAGVPSAPAVMTAFDPKKHGFHFVNQFKNIVVSQLDVITGGLCGGMAYSALDYFLWSKAIPQQDYMPAEGMPLQSYIYGRQVASIVSNVDRWAEMGLNPGGARNRELFNWGAQLGSGRLGELRAMIDAGKPVPLGLQQCGGDCGCPTTGEETCPASHQVLAIGYELGTYQGDPRSASVEEVTIFVYDPNFPDKTMRLKPSRAIGYYGYPDKGHLRWRTYFVDKNHGKPATAPPTFADKPNELIVQLVTGDDDLRGGSDNANVVLLMKDGTTRRFDDVNSGKRWVNGSLQSIARELPAGFDPSAITGVRVEATVSGGVGGDNWNLNKIDVRTRVGGALSTVLTRGDGKTLLFRFTGAAKQQTFPR